MISVSRNRSRRILAAAVVGTFAFSLGACGGGGDSGTVDSVVIGYSGPLSGGGAAYGENVTLGLEWPSRTSMPTASKAMETSSIELESLDDKYAPSTAASNAQGLADQDTAPVVVSPNAGAIKAIQQISSGRSNLLISAYTSDPAMKHGGKKLALLGTQSDYGQQWTTADTNEWKSADGEVGSENIVDYATVSDFAGPVSKALAEEPDAMVVGGPSQPTALIMEEARKQGFEGSFIVMDRAELNEMATVTDIEILTKSVGVLPVDEYEDPGTEEFLTKFADKAGEDKVATSATALNYQGVAVIAEAMELSGSTDDPETIRASIGDALAEVDDKDTVMGFPTEITDQGHLLNQELEVTHLDNDEEDNKVPVEQVSDAQ